MHRRFIGNGEHDAQRSTTFCLATIKSPMLLPAVRCELYTPSSEEGLIVRDLWSTGGAIERTIRVDVERAVNLGVFSSQFLRSTLSNTSASRKAPSRVSCGSSKQLAESTTKSTAVHLFSLPRGTVQIEWEHIPHLCPTSSHPPAELGVLPMPATPTGTVCMLRFDDLSRCLQRSK